MVELLLIEEGAIIPAVCAELMVSLVKDFARFGNTGLRQARIEAWLLPFTQITASASIIKIVLLGTLTPLQHRGQLLDDPDALGPPLDGGTPFTQSTPPSALMKWASLRGLDEA